MEVCISHTILDFCHRRFLMVIRCNVMTLAILGYLDLKKKWIPNVVLLGWAATIITCFLIGTTPINPSSVILSLAVIGIFYPLRRIVKCFAGDFKLYAVLMLAMEPKDSLWICFISMLISLFSFASGIKVVPMALVTFFGYITFLLFK